MSTRLQILELAYRNGYTDGLDWDLDGFASLEAVLADRYGWDEATISAVGNTGLVEKDAEGVLLALWDDHSSEICDAYNRGAHAGACAPQDQRTGKAPRDS